MAEIKDKLAVKRRTKEEKERLLQEIQKLGVVAGCRRYGVDPTSYYNWLERYKIIKLMKTKHLFLIAFSAFLLFFQGSCVKDDTEPFFFSCKINGEKWEALKYVLFSDEPVLAASAYHDPDSGWLQIGGSRSIKTPSKPDSYMQGGMTINIIDFEGEGSYTLAKYPGAGPGISYLLKSWATMEIWYAIPMPEPGTSNASTTDEYTGICTITKFDTKNQIIEGEYHFDALHRDYDVVANVTDGKFKLEYEIHCCPVKI